MHPLSIYNKSINLNRARSGSSFDSLKRNYIKKNRHLGLWNDLPKTPK